MDCLLICVSNMREKIQFFKKKQKFDQDWIKGFLTSANWMFTISAVLKKRELAVYIFENREDCRKKLFIFH